MIDISFKPSFVRQMNKLEQSLTDEVFEKIEQFKNPKNHKLLKVHKLHGKLKNMWSFSINYKIRIVFKYDSKKEVIFLIIGDHNIYN